MPTSRPKRAEESGGSGPHEHIEKLYNFSRVLKAMKLTELCDIIIILLILIIAIVYVIACMYVIYKYEFS